MASTNSYGSKWEDDLRGTHGDPNARDSLRVGMQVKTKDSGREGTIDIPLASRVNGWMYTVRFPNGTEKYPQSALRVGYRQDGRSPSPGYTTVAAAAANIMKICDTFLANGEVVPLPLVPFPLCNSDNCNPPHLSLLPADFPRPDTLSTALMKTLSHY